VTQITKGVANTTDTAPIHETPSPKKTSAAKARRRTPLDPKNVKATSAEKAEAKHTHEERKADKVTLGRGKALVMLRGGERDGQTSTIESHEHPFFVDEQGDLWVRKDEQQGDYRIYQFTTADGEALPTRQFAGPDLENRLQADLDALAAEEKAHPGSKKRPAG
jgi:hypothetical protein